MGMKLGISGAGGAMGIAGGEEAVALDELTASGAAAGQAGGLLEVVDPGLDRFGVGFAGLGADRGSSQRPGERDRLRRREGEIEAGDRAAVDVAQPERLARGGMAAGQHRDELVGLDLAGEPEILGPIAEPLTWGLALARVVVLGAFGDLLQVVALLAAAELSGGEHQRGPRGRSMPLLSGEAGACIG